MSRNAKREVKRSHIFFWILFWPVFANFLFNFIKHQLKPWVCNCLYQIYVYVNAHFRGWCFSAADTCSMFVVALDDPPSYVQHLRTKLTGGLGTRWRHVYSIVTERPLPSNHPRHHHYHLQQQQQQQVYEQTGEMVVYFWQRQICTKRYTWGCDIFGLVFPLIYVLL